MKAKVKMETEIEATLIGMTLAVRYGEEDIPNDFPGRQGDTLSLTVEIDTGRIRAFPEDREADIYMKVTDGGTYRIHGPDGALLKELVNEYVPHGLVPGEYGDYVEFHIKGGTITNWPKRPHLKDFFPED